MALTVSVALALYASWCGSSATPIVLSQASAGNKYHDTHYVVSNARSVWVLSLFYLAIAGASALIANLSVARATLPLVAFWLFHLAGPLSYFPTSYLIPRIAMPRKYVDYPAAFAFWNHVSVLSTFATCIAMLLLLAAIVVALAKWLRS